MFGMLGGDVTLSPDDVIEVTPLSGELRFRLLGGAAIISVSPASLSSWQWNVIVEFCTSPPAFSVACMMLALEPISPKIAVFWLVRIVVLVS